MSICDKCFNNHLCCLHSDNFMENAKTNGFCGKFLDAHRTATFPVAVGDKLWYIKGGYYDAAVQKPVEITVTEISQKIVRKKLEWGFIANGTRYSFSAIGKKVFFTRAEAEEAILGKALSKRKGAYAKWIICSDGYYPYCSRCKAEPKDGEKHRICPTCGALMEDE